MKTITMALMSMVTILYFTDFVYILKNKKYFLPIGKSGERLSATILDAWLSFMVSATALFIVISNLILDSQRDYFIPLIIILLISISRGKRKNKK